MDFMPGACLVASGGSDFWIRIWDARSGRELIRLAGHLGDIQALSFSPDGSCLATASSDGMVLLWDTATLRREERETSWQFAATTLRRMGRNPRRL